MFEDKTGAIEDYFDVKVKFKPKDQLKHSENQNQLFREIRIFHEEQN